MRRRSTENAGGKEPAGHEEEEGVLGQALASAFAAREKVWYASAEPGAAG